jgi:hypothetical protein
MKQTIDTKNQTEKSESQQADIHAIILNEQKPLKI